MQPKREIEIPEAVKHAIEWVVMWKYCRRARQRKRTVDRERGPAILEIADLIGKADNFEHAQRVHNVSLYVLLIDQDLSELMTDLVCAIGEKRKSHVARHLAVLFYEASKDLTELIGQDYRQSLKFLRIPDDFFEELNGASKLLNAFKNNHRSFLTGIRNLVAAHRSKDALAQHQIISTINPLEVAQLGPEFQAGVDRLTQFQLKIMPVIRGFDSMTRDFLDTHEKRKKSTP